MSNILGIDVGIGSIKIASISKTDDKLILDAIGEIKTPKVDWIKGVDKGKAVEEVSRAIRTLLVDLKVKSKQAVVCLPEEEVISRLINLPALKESEIRDALKFEAETFVPYPLDQVSIDYEVVSTDDTGKLTLFVIAARNDLIQTYIKMFKSTGLDLIALETSSVAIKRVLDISVKASGGIILVDLGEMYTNVVNINKGNVYLTRSVNIGGESITRAISLSLSLDMASAEEYKKAYGLKEDQLEGKIRAAILPVFTSISEEIRKAMALFSESQGVGVSLLVLSGGGANLPGFAEELTKVLGVEVQIIQPFLKVDVSKVNPPFNLNVEGCRFSLATGLALRGSI